MLTLHNLVPLVKKKKRIGRGGSRGGTSGKGHKGQLARSGGSQRLGFEGGQMPLFRRLPKRGFTNVVFKKDVYVVNLRQLEGQFDAGAHVDRAALIEKGLIKVKKGREHKVCIKILAAGSLTKKLTVVVDACSATAQKMIQDLGGEVRLTKEI